MRATQSIGNAAHSPAANVAERSRTVAAQAGLVAALIVLPLIYTLVPPLQDYPNHLARMFALASLPGNETLGRFYQVEWAAIPNLIMDLVVPPLVPVFGVYLAGRIFIGATLLLMLLGPMALQRAVYGRWSAWPLVGGIFVYNGFSVCRFDELSVRCRCRGLRPCRMGRDVGPQSAPARARQPRVLCCSLHVPPVRSRIVRAFHCELRGVAPVEPEAVSRRCSCRVRRSDRYSVPAVPVSPGEEPDLGVVR